MKVGYIQFDVKRDFTQNLQTIETHLQKMDADLVVLPELSTCGYLFENMECLLNAAEPVPGGNAVAEMQKLSQKYHCALIFGLAELDSGRIYNTAALVDRGEYVGKYRKMHLTKLEQTLFDRGTSNQVFEIAGCKVGVEICFDIWFPEVFREQLRMGAQLFCALANFGGETTSSICPLRALENMTPMVLCNRIGHETAGNIDAEYLGRSAILDGCGKPLQIAQDHWEASSVCEITLPTLRSNVMCSNLTTEIELHYESSASRYQ